MRIDQLFEAFRDLSIGYPDSANLNDLIGFRRFLLGPAGAFEVKGNKGSVHRLQIIPPFPAGLRRLMDANPLNLSRNSLKISQPNQA